MNANPGQPATAPQRIVGRVFNKTSQKGNHYMKIVLEGKWYVAFENTRKRDERDSDFIIYESEERKAQAPA